MIKGGAQNDRLRTTGSAERPGRLHVHILGANASHVWTALSLLSRRGEARPRSETAQKHVCVAMFTHVWPINPGSRISFTRSQNTPLFTPTQAPSKFWARCMCMALIPLFTPCVCRRSGRARSCPRPSRRRRKHSLQPPPMEVPIKALRTPRLPRRNDPSRTRTTRAS